MRIIMAFLAIALVSWAEAASAQKTYSVSVSRYSGKPDLTEKEVQNILDDASELLQKNTSHVCNVTFTLKSPILTFESPEESPKVVHGDRDIDELHRLNDDVAGVDFHVKIVEKIGFCRGVFNGNIRGCAFPPKFRSIIVIHPKLQTAAPSHIVWAHEFGHLAGLPHRKDDQRALMKCGGVTNVSVQVNKRECDCLLKPGSCELPKKKSFC